MATTGVKPQVCEAGSLTPAFYDSVSGMQPSVNTSVAELPIFSNPVAGNVDTTSTHTGDVGGAA